MANIKNKIIHLLGGVTKKERDGDAVAAKVYARWEGKKLAFQEILDTMNNLYGNPKWGEIIYNYVKESLEEISKA